MKVRSALLRARARILALAWMSTFGIACGDDGSGSPDGGGGGGGAGGSDGGSRDVLYPAPQGSVSLHVADPSDNTVRCPMGRQWINAPSTSMRVQTQQTSGTAIGTRAVDGVDKSKVKCSVEKSGSGFAFAADITTPNIIDGVADHPTALHFDVPAIAAKESGAIGTVSILHPSALMLFEDDHCTFSVATESLDVAEGKIWATVTCGALVDTTTADPNAVCALDVGYLVFENCAH